MLGCETMEGDKHGQEHSLSIGCGEVYDSRSDDRGMVRVHDLQVAAIGEHQKCVGAKNGELKYFREVMGTALMSFDNLPKGFCVR